MDPLNLLAPEFRANPYPYYARLRRQGPTRVAPQGLWAVARYEDVVAVLKNPGTFSSQGFRAAAIQPWLPENPIVDSLIFLDPPRHGRIRSLVAHAFGARVLPRVEPLARRVAVEFAERARAGLTTDLCQDLALTLPAGVIAKLLGFDDSRTAQIRAWTDDLHSISAATPAADQPRIRRSILELSQYLAEIFASRRQQRQPDLASDMLAATIDGEQLTEAELIGFMFQLIVAGFETTGHLIAQAIRVLIEHPELLERLRADPSGIPGFIEEVLRYEPSAHGLMRLVRTDTEIGGVSISAGSTVLALIGAANRDEDHYEDPDRFDMDRRQKQSLAFGHGIHFCIGAALARLEACIALQELLPRVKAIGSAGDVEWNRSLTVRGPVRMPVRFEGA